MAVLEKGLVLVEVTFPGETMLRMDAIISGYCSTLLVPVELDEWDDFAAMDKAEQIAIDFLAENGEDDMDADYSVSSRNVENGLSGWERRRLVWDLTR